MAKDKKKTPVAQQQLSPEKYIRTKARNLPIDTCLIRDMREEIGICLIVVVRRHTNGNYTVGFYQVDTFCLGVKDSYFIFNKPQDEYDEIIECLNSESALPLCNTTYEEAHNLIYGAVDYADECGIKPHPVFNLTQYILEEDTDDIPLIEYEFGKDGQPLLITTTSLEANKYLPILKQHLGENFKYLVMDENGNEDEDINTTELAAKLELLRDNLEQQNQLPIVEYNYAYPEYPTTLSLYHPVLQLLFLPVNNDYLNQEQLADILSLPRETLIADLEHIILYEIGRINKKIKENEESVDYQTAVVHAIFLLGELRAEESLDTLLELLRQNSEFMDYVLGDAGMDIIPLTLYYTGRNHLPDLLDFIREPNLYCFLKYYVFPTVAFIAQEEPLRKEEVIEWFRDVLNLFFSSINDKTIFDAILTGMMMSDLIDLKTTKLLPEIKRLMDTNLVDEMSVGNYTEIESSIRSNKSLIRDIKTMDINERYQEFKKKWK